MILDSNISLIDETGGGFEVGVILDSNISLIDETGRGFEVGVTLELVTHCSLMRQVEDLRLW